MKYPVFLALFVCAATARAAESPVMAGPGHPAGGIQETAAIADMSAIATALDFVALDTGYFVPLEALDDIVAQPPTGSIQDINRNGGARVIRPQEGYFRTNPVVFTAAQWTGPYINYQQGRTQTGFGLYDPGSPLDPWGTPYFFFSPLGLIRGEPATITQEYYGDQFDRYTIVCFGGDRAFGGGDDLAWQIPVAVSSLAASSISGSRTSAVTQLGEPVGGTFYVAEAGSRITIHGYAFGGGPPGGGVSFGPSDLTAAVVAWSGREVTLDLPLMLSGTRDVRLGVGMAQSNPLRLVILPNAVTHWQLYE